MSIVDFLYDKFFVSEEEKRATKRQEEIQERVRKSERARMNAEIEKLKKEVAQAFAESRKRPKRRVPTPGIDGAVFRPQKITKFPGGKVIFDINDYVINEITDDIIEETMEDLVDKELGKCESLWREE